MLKKLRKMYPHQTLMLIFFTGLLIIAGSFITEHLFGVDPCPMCLWQRYLAVGITIVAFAGTLFRGRIKKLFLATITILALASIVVGTWQSLAQKGLVKLPEMCAKPTAEVVQADLNSKDQAASLLGDLKEDNTGYVDCSKPEAGFFFYDLTGISLANLNVVIMTLIALLSFYKLFFKPRKRFRRYNNNRNNNRNNNNNRRYRGSGYNRNNNRNNNRSHHSNGNRRPHHNNNRRNSEES